MARKLMSSEFNDLPDDVIVGDVDLVLGGKYELTLRPLTWGLLSAAGRSVPDTIRYGLVSGGEDELKIKYEDCDIAGTTYRVATLASVNRLPAVILNHLAAIIMKITHIEGPEKPDSPATDAEKIDFTSAV